MEYLYTIAPNPNAPRRGKRRLYHLLKDCGLLRWHNPTQKEFESGEPVHLENDSALFDLHEARRAALTAKLLAPNRRGS